MNRAEIMYMDEAAENVPYNATHQAVSAIARELRNVAHGHYSHL